MKETETLAISRAIEPPGAVNTKTVGAKLEAPLRKDKYAAWLDEQQGKCLCELC